MITQGEFEEKVKEFGTLADFRDEIEGWCSELIGKNQELEGLCFMLFTWNFANMRRMLKTFSIKKFKEVLREINPIFAKLKKEKFEIADFDKLKDDVGFIYSKLLPLVQQTGTTKLMYFKNPNLFVMWDTKIRSKWKIKKVDSESYLAFLKLMQKEFFHIKWDNKSISLARAIDMYNYAVTQKVKDRKE